MERSASPAEAAAIAAAVERFVAETTPQAEGVPTMNPWTRAALLINLAVLEALVGGTSLGDLSAQAIAVAVAMPFNFLGNKLWTFA